MICAAIGGGRIRRPWRFRRHNCRVVKYSRLRCRRDRRLSHIRGSPLLRISARCLRMLSLNRDRGKVSLTRYSLLLRSRTRVDPAIAAVVADVVHVVVDYRCVVNVVNLANVHIVHGALLEEATVLPTSAFITLTEIAETVTDPAVETYLLAPVTHVTNKTFPPPAPIA